MIGKLLKRIYAYFEKKKSTGHYWQIREKSFTARGPAKYYYKYIWTKTVRKRGAYIPFTAKFAGKPAFPHDFYGIFISSGASIGSGCTIFHHVTIGSNTIAGSKNHGAPTIGDNVYIGAGAKIIGGVHIGNNVRIGANCVVTKDIPDNSTVVLPSPRVITHDAPQDNEYVSWPEYRENIR